VLQTQLSPQHLGAPGGHPPQKTCPPQPSGSEPQICPLHWLRGVHPHVPAEQTSKGPQA